MKVFKDLLFTYSQLLYKRKIRCISGCGKNLLQIEVFLKHTTTTKNQIQTALAIYFNC